MVNTKNVTQTLNMPVYTDDGEYYGDIVEPEFTGNRISSWKIKSTRHSKLSKLLSGARGVRVPHSLVRAIGDIMIISKSAAPEVEGSEEKLDEI